MNTLPIIVNEIDEISISIAASIIKALIESKRYESLTFDTMKVCILASKDCRQYVDDIPTLSNEQKEYLLLL